MSFYTTLASPLCAALGKAEYTTTPGGWYLSSGPLTLLPHYFFSSEAHGPYGVPAVAVLGKQSITRLWTSHPGVRLGDATWCCVRALKAENNGAWILEAYGLYGVCLLRDFTRISAACNFFWQLRY